MNHKPILFSAEMVRALLEGRKTMTRREIKKMPASLPGWWKAIHWASNHHFIKGAAQHCTYGRPGDLLWVRETSRAHELTTEEAERRDYGTDYYSDFDEVPPYGWDGVIYHADNVFRVIENSMAASEAWVIMHHYRGKRGATVPPIHMPKWASRLTLKITDVRVERVREISTEDAIAEGVTLRHGLDHPPVAFQELWKSINGPDSWDANPWVWVISFKTIEQNVLEYVRGLYE